MKGAPERAFVIANYLRMSLDLTDTSLICFADLEVMCEGKKILKAFKGV